MLNQYKIRIVSDGLINTIHPRYGLQIWSKSKMTKLHKNDACAQCGHVVGDFALRPITNLGNRMERICLRHLTLPAPEKGDSPAPEKSTTPEGDTAAGNEPNPAPCG